MIWLLVWIVIGLMVEVHGFDLLSKENQYYFHDTHMACSGVSHSGYTHRKVHYEQDKDGYQTTNGKQEEAISVSKRLVIKQRYWVITQGENYSVSGWYYFTEERAKEVCDNFYNVGRPPNEPEYGYQWVDRVIEYEPNTCPRCGATEGDHHVEGCDAESCSYCGEVRIYCNCPPEDNHRRMPYIYYPQVCAKCGELWPSFFMVPDEEWRHYIEPRLRSKIICADCYAIIKRLIDGREEKRDCSSEENL